MPKSIRYYESKFIDFFSNSRKSVVGNVSKMESQYGLYGEEPPIKQQDISAVSQFYAAVELLNLYARVPVRSSATSKVFGVTTQRKLSHLFHRDVRHHHTKAVQKTIDDYVQDLQIQLYASTMPEITTVEKLLTELKDNLGDAKLNPNGDLAHILKAIEKQTSNDTSMFFKPDAPQLNP